MQWDAATKGNIVMMIFLGKQLLGQSDKLDQKIDATVETLSSSDRAYIDDVKKMLKTIPNERDKK